MDGKLKTKEATVIVVIDDIIDHVKSDTRELTWQGSRVDRGRVWKVYGRGFTLHGQGKDYILHVIYIYIFIYSNFGDIQ